MQLQRYWLSKFFIKNHVSLKVNHQGILLNNTLINWSEIDTFPHIESHFFFCSFNWQVNSIQHQFNWVSKKNALNAVKEAVIHWTKIKRKPLINLANSIKVKMNKGYLRKCTFDDIQRTAASQLIYWPKKIELFSFDKKTYQALQFLHLVVNWGDKHLVAFQNNYIDKQKSIYQNYFQSMESNPLTDKQQTACIVDEQNNLVLAGAGTGKTSAMVGRVGYLLNSNQATESDFLLLAFGTKAANEMKLRIEEKLNLQSIKVNTFHSLGLSIITSVESKPPNISELAASDIKKQNWIRFQFKQLLAQSDFKSKTQKYCQTFLNAHKTLDRNIDDISKSLSQLIGLYKLGLFDKKQLQTRLSQHKDHNQIKAELELLSPIYQLYQKHLLAHDEIDFEDMIIKAIHYVETNKFKSNWKHILVDEFQDISEPRARLVKTLKNQVAKASLFCVGDDWQAIYRFTGADVNLTTQFENYFGTTQTTALDKTFRFNNSISDIASTFVMQNPAQSHKKMLTHNLENKPKISLYQGDNEDKLNHILTEINNQAQPSLSIYILARYKFNLPDITLLNSMYNNLNIKIDTFHASKGNESDQVIILGLKSGKYGFPAEKKVSPLLDSLLPKPESFEHAEERRLFYVALTRAKHQVHLLYDANKPSQFVIELIDNNYAIEYNPISTSKLKEAV